MIGNKIIFTYHDTVYHLQQFNLTGGYLFMGYRKGGYLVSCTTESIHSKWVLRILIYLAR